MARTARFRRLLDKADAALISAIEVYNKPDFAYREETFAILALNAWELLVKARVLYDNANNIRSLYIYEQRQNSAGVLRNRRYIRRNRSGNPQTKTLFRLVRELEADAATRLPAAVQANLAALVEIRDNAVHFVNVSPSFAKRVLEIGTASFKNYIELSKRWFQRDYSEYDLYVMPIGFLQPPGSATALLPTATEKKLINYLDNLSVQGTEDAPRGFHVALEVNISLKRVTEGSLAAEYRISDDPSATQVQLSEEDVRAKYPWDYGTVTSTLRNRYLDFKVNKQYHEIRKSLTGDQRYMYTRFLDPGNVKSQKKDYFNPNILQMFDGYYTRR